MQWYYSITRCEKETLSSTTVINETRFNNFDRCILIYSSKGLPYLIEIFLLNIQLLFIQILSGIEWILYHKAIICMFMFICLSVYGTIHRQSDAFITLSAVFHLLRQDLLAAMFELWSSFKNTFITLFRVITVVKVMEIIVIGLFLSGVLDLVDFLSKTLAKTAKILVNKGKSSLT